MTDVEELLNDTADYFEIELKEDQTRLELAGLLQNNQTPSIVRILNGMPNTELVIVVRRCQE